MKIKVYEDRYGDAVYKVGGRYYPFPEQAPRSQAEFNKRWPWASRVFLKRGQFSSVGQFPRIIHGFRFLLEVEA